jgi:uncharacterized OB-fold protein
MRACTKQPEDGEVIGKACSDCGHTNLVHPHRVYNHTLTACVLCLLVEKIKQ